MTVHTRSDSTGHRVENSLQLHSTEEKKYDVAREYYVESELIPQGVEICMCNKDKIPWTKYQSKMIQNAIMSDCHMSDRPIRSM